MVKKKDKKKKKKQYRTKHPEYKLLQERIQNNNFHKTNLNYIEKYEDTKTWFNNNIYESDNVMNIPNITDFKEVNEHRKTKMIEIDFNEQQQKIFQRWIKAYTIMYNETVKYIKNTPKCSLNYKKLRTNILKNKRDEIVQNSGIDNKTNIYVHIIDTAIKLACANYKSALTNKKLGNIKHFRIRYWRFNKSSITIEIEKQHVKDGFICKNIFGDIKYINFDNSNLNQTCSIRYDRKQNKYYLLIPEKIEISNEEQKDTITLDPGIHTFMTGLSENKIIKYGDECYKYIKKKLEFTDKIINNEKISIKIKNKIRKRNEKKIQNRVNELHWKVINNLINNYQNILIGDMSVKGIVKNGVSNLNKMTKRLAYKLKFYQFRQRLEYKCNTTNRNYKVVNERYTSKTCSNCGYYKENLGGNRIFECNKCKNTIDRDVNACKCILLKGIHN